MPPSVDHPDEVIILSSDDEGELQNDRGSDQKKIVEMASTDSEEFSDDESEANESSDTDSSEANGGSDTDSSESLPCIVPCRSPKEPVKITAADSRTKAEPVDSKLSKQSSKESTKVGGSISRRGNAKNGADNDWTIQTERNVRRKIDWNCNDFRLVKDETSPEQAVIHGTESTDGNRQIDRKEKFTQAAVTSSSTSRKFDPVFEVNGALRDLLQNYGNKSNDLASDIDISAMWYSREKAIHKDGLSITLSDEEIQRRNNTKAETEAIISAATKLTRQFHPDEPMSRQQLKEYMTRQLTEYGSSLHQMVDAMDAKTNEALPAAKKNSESAIKRIVKGVYKAVKAI